MLESTECWNHSRAFDGKGWALLWAWQDDDDDEYLNKRRYGFVRFTEQVERSGAAESHRPQREEAQGRAWEVHDLRPFLAQMVAEGRPSASERDVRTLEDLLKWLQTDHN